MKIRINFSRQDNKERFNLVKALQEAGFHVQIENTTRYLDGRIYVEVDDERIEQA